MKWPKSTFKVDFGRFMKGMNTKVDFGRFMKGMNGITDTHIQKCVRHLWGLFGKVMEFGHKILKYQYNQFILWNFTGGHLWISIP